jgi:hypothetical protein
MMDQDWSLRPALDTDAQWIAELRARVQDDRPFRSQDAVDVFMVRW